MKNFLLPIIWFTILNAPLYAMESFKQLMTRDQTKKEIFQSADDDDERMTLIKEISAYPPDIQQRFLAGYQMTKRIEKVLYKNGFSHQDKTALDDINESLKNADISEDASFKSFVKLARTATAFMEEFTDPKIFAEQVYLLGFLTLLNERIKINSMKRQVVPSRKKTSTVFVAEIPKARFKTLFTQEADGTEKKQALKTLNLEDGIE